MITQLHDYDSEVKAMQTVPAPCRTAANGMSARDRMVVGTSASARTVIPAAVRPEPQGTTVSAASTDAVVLPGAFVGTSAWRPPDLD